MPDSQALYNAFDPSPLHQGQRDLYVDLDPVRGESSLAASLLDKIERAATACLAITGHRGSGKSTELWCLRQQLEKPSTSSGNGYFVVQVQADDELDRNDIDFADILVAVIRQLALQMKSRLNIKLKPGFFKDRWQRIKEFALMDLDLESVELEVGMAKLSGTLKHSYETRRKIRAALDGEADSWLKAANEVIGEAILKLHENKYRGLVIIVDDLDKMIVREHATAGCLTTEYLFVHRSAQLTAFGCHTIYTLPIELAYSHHESTLRRNYGGDIPVVPMTKLRTPPPEGAPFEPGMQKFREIIAARLRSAGAVESDLFASDALRDDLILYTGGQPSELMTFIRDGFIGAELPITEKSFRRVKVSRMRSYDRQLRAEHWPIIETARATGRLPRTADNERLIRELLESRALLLYQNEKSWYGVNPALDTLTPPPPPAPPAPALT